MNSSAASVEDFRSVSYARSQRPRLSVVLISRGDELSLERALLAITDMACALDAQMVVVREAPDGPARDRVQRLTQMHGCAIAFTEPGVSRIAMSEAAMKVVTGDIVTLRDDVSIVDGEWLGVFAGSLGVALSPPVEFERPTPIADERAAAGARPSPDRSARIAHSTRRRAEATSDSVS